MATDLGDVIGKALGSAARDAAQNVASNARKTTSSSRNGSLSGPAKGLAAGAGLALLAPLAAKGASKLARGATDSAKDTVGKGLKEGVDKTVGKAGGKGGIVKKLAKDAIPGADAIPGMGDDSEGGSGQKNEAEGAGKGRRMPVQQSVDIGAPLKEVYNEWTQFEEWPKFMHRLQSVSQEDETHVSFKAKIWLFSRDFKAEILEQRPDERIKWKVTDGITHTGVVTFHEVAPRLTRVEVNLDVDPSGLIEKGARGMRHVKRAVRADMARFKAYVMMNEEADGEWRGRIEDGEVKKQRSSSSSRRRSSASSKSKSSGSSSGSRSASSRSKGSSNGSGSSGSGRSRTRAKSRSSSNGGSGGSSRSSSSRKKSSSRS